MSIKDLWKKVSGFFKQLWEDVKKVFTDVTAHRMILDSRARYKEQSAKDILEEILKDTSAPKVEGE